MAEESKKNEMTDYDTLIVSYEQQIQALHDQTYNLERMIRNYQGIVYGMLCGMYGVNG